jgi:hypothetical protein
VTNAQLYWDDQDPANSGWQLRFLNVRGTEQSCAVKQSKDATLLKLVAAVEAAIGADSMLTGRIKVFRGDAPRGEMRLMHGAVTDWRAL